MKLITAIVKPDKLAEVMDAVTGSGAHGLTAADARGFGQQYGQLGTATGKRKAALLPKVRVDVVVQDEDADTAAGAIAKAVNTGMIGDGKIWITTVDSALRVRTGERDRDAV